MHAGRWIQVSGAVAAFAAALTVGCAGEPDSDLADTPIEPTTTYEFRAPDLPLPASVSKRPPSSMPAPELLATARLEPLTGEELRRANRSLDEVLKRIPPPGYLKAAPDDDAQPSDEEPAGEVLKLYIEARDAFHNNAFADALELINQAIEADPDSAALHELLGRIYLEINQHERALQQLRRALSLDADLPLALFVLGRVAYERDDWDEAAATLGRALKSPDTSMDPGLRYLIVYYLGQTLLRQGYDAAAVEQLIEFHREPERFSRTTRLMRQVMSLARQRDAAATQIADAYMRLDRVDEALHWYDEAADSDRLSRVALLSRLIYAHLRAGQYEQAEDFTVRRAAEQADDSAMELIRYVAAHTDDRPRFIDRLTQAYEQARHSQSMALAVIGAVPQADESQFDDFVRRDLAEQPDHVQVFDLWLKRLGSEDPGRAVVLAVQLIRRSAHHAGEIAATLLDGLKLDAAGWQAVMDALPADIRDSAAGFYLHGMAAMRRGDLAAADAAFQNALDHDFGFMPARIAVIELELARGNAVNALQLIGPVDTASPPRLRYLHAVAMQATGRPDAALAEIDRLLADFPHNVEYLLAKARLQRQRADFSGAEATLLRLLTVDPAHEPAYVELFGIYEQDQPNATKFVQLLGRARAVIPASRVARLMSARLMIAQSNLDEAEQLLRPLAAEYPTDIQVLGALVSTLGRSGQWDQAMTLLEALLDESVDNAAAIHLLRQVARRSDAMDRFYPHYEKYLKAQPDSALIRLQLAQLYEQWDRPDDAIAACLAALEMGFEDPALVHAQLAQLYQQADQPDQAVASVDHAIMLAPQRAAFYVVKGWLLHEQKRTDAAIDTLNTALGLPVDDPEQVRLELARLYAAVDRFDDAIALVDQVIATRPGQAADLYYFQAAMLHGKPNADKLAETILLKALNVDPDHVPANNDLGYSWADQGRNLARAEQMIRKAVDAEPDTAPYLDSMGWVKYKQGDFTEAIRWLERAAAAPGGQDPTIIDHLADAYWQDNRRDEAAELWRDTVEQLLQREGELEEYQRTVLERAQLKLRAVESDQLPAVAEVPQRSLDDPAPITAEPAPPQPAMQ